MGRKAGTKNKRTLEFTMLYDELCLEMGNPTYALFSIVNGRYRPEHKINAAKVLLAHRFAKPKELPESIQGELTLVWDSEEDDKAA